MNLDSSIFTGPAVGALAVSKKHKNEPLSDCVRNALENYFNHLDGHGTQDLYRMVMAEVERPLFVCVMEHLGGNQTRAAEVLGISRSTLRKKLALYGIE
jgi:Fis family transcriptional regulator